MTRAVWFTAPRELELRDATVRDPEPNEVTVRSAVSLISPGTEMNLFRGESGLRRVSLPTAEGELPFPIKYGYQVVGAVEAAGPDTGLDVGDLVFACHPHQEHFTIDASVDETGAALLHRLPAGYDIRRAAFVNLYTVAHNALLDAPVRPGDCVAVSGLGVIGSFAACLARRNAARLLVIDPDARRRSAAGWVGADAIVDPSEAAVAAAELSEGRGVDVSIEASGAPAALQTAIDITGLEGTVAVISYYGSRSVRLDLSASFHHNRHRLISSFVGHPGGGPLWTRQRALATAAEDLKRVPIERLISHELAFEQAVDAYAAVDDPAVSTLGVLLNYDRSPEQ